MEFKIPALDPVSSRLANWHFTGRHPRAGGEPACRPMDPRLREGDEGCICVREKRLVRAGSLVGTSQRFIAHRAVAKRKRMARRFEQCSNLLYLIRGQSFLKKKWGAREVSNSQPLDFHSKYECIIGSNFWLFILIYFGYLLSFIVEIQ